MSFNLKINRLEDFEKRISKISSPQLGQQIKRTMEITADQIRDRARGVVSVDTGQLRMSINSQVKFNTNRWVARIGPSQPYGLGVEQGTPPHYVSGVVLESWAKKRGLNPWAVAMNIRKKGTQKHPYMKPTFDSIGKLVENNFRALIKALSNI